MDLVFAEEKYSKTGQLEKVREVVAEGGTVQSLLPVAGEAKDSAMYPRRLSLLWAVAPCWSLFWLAVQIWGMLLITLQVFSCFQVVELVTGGAQVPVTNENKILYLNLLAQYRLANQVREEVDHFLKGNLLPAPCSFLPW